MVVDIVAVEIQGWINPFLVLILDRVLHCSTTKAISEKTNSESHNHFPDSMWGIQWGKAQIQHFAGRSFPHVCTDFICWLVDTQGKVKAAFSRCLPSYGSAGCGWPQKTRSIPGHLWEGSDPSALHSHLCTPAGNTLLFLLTLLDQLHRLLNISCPIIFVLKY